MENFIFCAMLVNFLELYDCFSLKLVQQNSCLAQINSYLLLGKLISKYYDNKVLARILFKQGIKY